MTDKTPPPDDTESEPAPNKKRSPNKANVPITLEMYEQLARAYLDAPRRSARALSRDTGFSLSTCRRAIDRGWPNRQWSSLRERAVMYDARKNEQTDRPPLSPEEVMDGRRFLELRNANVNTGRMYRGLAGEFAKRLFQALDGATCQKMGSRRTVINEVKRIGNRDVVVSRVVTEDVMLPPYLPDIARAIKDIGQLAFEAGEVERIWARVPKPEGIDAEVTKIGWDKLTDEDIEYMEKNGGRLPPGITIEQLKDGA